MESYQIFKKELSDKTSKLEDYKSEIRNIRDKFTESVNNIDQKEKIEDSFEQIIETINDQISEIEKTSTNLRDN